MSKRDAPESGFDAASLPKRQGTNNTSAFASHTEYPVPSNTRSVPPTVPPARVNGSATQLPPPSPEAHHHDEDSFLPDPQLSNAANQDDELFVPDEVQRSELVKELSRLQGMPASAMDQISDPTSIDEEESQQDEEEHRDDSGAEQPTPQSFPGGRSNRNSDRPRSKRRKTNFYEPRLWHDGAPDSEAALTARKSDALICGTTNITLDTEPLLVNGTLWKDVLLDELPHLLRTDASIPMPPAQDKYDFFKACFRMGSFIEPDRMSRLLGGGYRTPEYCAFLLQGFLGLLNNPKVRRVLKGGAPPRPAEGHRDVVVYGDQLYPSDDEIILTQEKEASTEDPEKERVSQDGNTEVAVIEESDREEDEGHKDPPQVNLSAVHETRHKSTSEQRFLLKPSYVLRNYMSIVTGQQSNDMDEFEVYCKKLGATFLADPRRQPLGRLKWLKERMPAPELWAESGISEPLELWKHAMKTYSSRNLSRCAVIRVDPLLDWLGFDAHESSPATSEEEYFRTKRPVVAIAPMPLLYLADKAVDFVLRVLSMAAQTEELNPRPEDEDEGHFVIDGEDVKFAMHNIVETAEQRPPFYFSTDLLVLGDEGSYSSQWPALVQRPLTASESLELCDRSPKASISLPNNITDEMRAVVMSFRPQARRRLYTNPKLFKNKDPVAYMSPAERKEWVRKRKQRNRENGIRWPRKGAEGNDGDDRHEEDSASPVAQEGIQRSPAEGSQGQVPAVDQTLGSKDPASTTNEPAEGAGKLPKFFDQVNLAELAAFRIGEEELSRRQRNMCNIGAEWGYGGLIADAALFLKESITDRKWTTSTVCLHRLGWICLHALGIDMDKSPDDSHPMGYASSANYTNFGQFRTTKPVILTTGALRALAQMADIFVREEVTVLMACAAHDDGRPWIDRADVALVTSVRKEEFHYTDV